LKIHLGFFFVLTFLLAIAFSMPLRAATRDDAPILFQMVVELAAFEKMESEVVSNLERFTQDFEDGRFRGFIVIDDETEKPSGMVVFSYRYDCWKGKFMYMNELFVRPEYRYKKYGKLLWAAVAKVAKDEDACEIVWRVLDWNQNAIRFYQSVKGVSETKNDSGFLSYKMTREGIEQFGA
ncbi:hypothetical protein PENTCL1PPCAC_16222, partial [Pristionchus entomophagus]